jgi:hypothetical protein
MTTEAYIPPRYISGKEQAQMLRAALKAEFPGVKSSVRNSRGSAIDVRWTDGPRSSRVQEVCDRFAGGGFDGMQDLRYSVRQELATGEVVQFLQDFVMAQRDISDAWQTEILDEFERIIGREIEREGWEMWRKQVPLAIERYGEQAGRILHMDEVYTEDLSTVFHQYTGTHDR